MQLRDKFLQQANFVVRASTASKAEQIQIYHILCWISEVDSIVSVLLWGLTIPQIHYQVLRQGVLPKLSLDVHRGAGWWDSSLKTNQIVESSVFEKLGNVWSNMNAKAKLQCVDLKHYRSWCHPNI